MGKKGAYKNGLFSFRKTSCRPTPSNNNRLPRSHAGCVLPRRSDKAIRVCGTARDHARVLRRHRHFHLARGMAAGRYPRPVLVSESRCALAGRWSAKPPWSALSPRGDEPRKKPEHRGRPREAEPPRPCRSPRKSQDLRRTRKGAEKANAAAVGAFIQAASSTAFGLATTM